MRRSAVLVLLLLCAAAVGFLFLQAGGNGRAASRRVEAELGKALPGDAAVEAATETEGASGAVPKDDDPNRVPGPDLLLRGQVVRDGVGVEGAAVVALRTFATQDYSPARYAAAAFDMPPPPIATTVTEAGGRFELRVARRTRLILRASKPGSGAAALFLLMPAEGDPPEVTLRLRPGSRLEGIVVDEKAAPVAAATVVLGTQDWTRPVTETAATTDGEGRFVLEDVSDGTYRIRVQAKGYPEARVPVTVPMQRFVKIELCPAGVVTGTVKDGKGALLAGARVMITTMVLERPGASGTGKAETDASGVYRVEIYPGSVQSAFVEHPLVGRHVAAEDSFDLPTGLVETGKELKYDIKLKPGVPVRGRAVYEGTGQPASGASIALLKMQQQWRGMNEVATMRADDDGQFEFAYVTEGTYALEAKGEKGARLPTRYPQNNQRITIDFFVDGLASPPEQRLELSATGGVRGRLFGVGESDMYQRPSIYLQHAQGYATAVVDDVGVFDIAHVPPMEDAVLTANNPTAKSDPFRVEAGKVTEVNLDPGRQGITGIVEDESGRPVPRARVQMCAQNQLRHYMMQFIQNRGWGGALTDEQGRFSLAPGHWNNDYYRSQKFILLATRDGYAMTIGTETFDLPQEGKEAPPLRLVMRKGGTIRGRVEHVGGSPAVNLVVTANPKQEQGQQGRPDPAAPLDSRTAQTTYTGFDGSFEIGGISDGVYLVSAYHPLGKIEPREVRVGDDAVKLVIEPAHAIAGVVVFESGKPAAYAMVNVIVPKERGEQMMGGQAQANGRFRVGQLSPGSYAVEVTPNAQGGASAGFEKKRVEGVATGTEDVVIVVSEGKGLRGKVEDMAGNAIAGAGVIAMPILPPEQPAQQGMAPRPRQVQGSQAPAAVTNGRGEFEIKGVGSAEVEVMGLAEGYTPSTQRAVAGGAPVLLRLEGGAVIEGRILKADGKPLARHYLWIQSTSRDTQAKLMDWQQRGGQAWNTLGGWGMQGAMTDTEGKFRFGGLLPGEYRLQLQVGDEVLPATNLQTGMPSATLRLERALTIRGRVVGPEGQPVVLPGGQMVNVSARKGEQWFSSTVVGADGRFELRGLAPGTVTLQVWAGNDFKLMQVDVVAGTDSLLITLERNQPQPAK